MTISRATTIWAAALAALIVAGQAQAATPAWVRDWAAAPSYQSPERDVTAEGQTLRQTVRLMVSGKSIRIQLSNEHGREPLAIGAVTVGVHTGEQMIFTPLTFGGRPGVTIQTGAPALSDPVALTVQSEEVLEISIYLPVRAVLSTGHWDNRNPALLSTQGDFTRAAALPVAQSLKRKPLLAAVDVLPDRPMTTIVAFGDSITDADCTIGPTLCRWSDVLADRLRRAGKPYAVANLGISGNRILTAGAGLSALARFDRDVLSAPNLSHIVLLEGINDIGSSGPAQDGRAETPIVGAEEMIEGYRQIIARAHERGVKVIGAEILPFEGAKYASPAKEAVRQAVNTWIRTSEAFDGLIDFAGAVADPANPLRLAPTLQTGDNLHPNPAGQRVMGEAIDLLLF